MTPQIIFMAPLNALAQNFNVSPILLVSLKFYLSTHVLHRLRIPSILSLLMCQILLTSILSTYTQVSSRVSLSRLLQDLQNVSTLIFSSPIGISLRMTSQSTRPKKSSSSCNDPACLGRPHSSPPAIRRFLRSCPDVHTSSYPRPENSVWIQEKSSSQKSHFSSWYCHETHLPP